jgi:hypothetical protein
MKETRSETTWTVGALADYLYELEGKGFGGTFIQVDVPAGTEAGEITDSFVVESGMCHTGTSYNEKNVTRSVKIVLGGA